MHQLVAFAKPFRMPDFFLISGLFLARVIDRDWRTYLDRKVVHFAYFYVVWVTVQFAFKAPAFAAEHGWAGVAAQYLLSFIEPFGTLWFIYLLPVFFVVTKLARGVHPVLIWVAAAALESARIHTGWTVIDEFAGRFVYFYSGYLFATQVFSFAQWVRNHRLLAMAGLAGWAIANGVLVFAGYGDWPVMSLALGFAGACAIIALATLLAEARLLDGLRYCGEHSIVIYLAFFLPMAATRSALIKSGMIADAGAIALVVTTAGLLGALVIWWATRGTRLRFLFERPAAFWLTPRHNLKAQPAE
jgi:uncharacterized membrane protein YcfT